MSRFEEDEGIDYYATLNVSKDSSQEDVTKAYRRLAQASDQNVLDLSNLLQ